MSFCVTGDHLSALGDVSLRFDHDKYTTPCKTFQTSHHQTSGIEATESH